MKVSVWVYYSDLFHSHFGEVVILVTIPVVLVATALTELGVGPRGGAVTINIVDCSITRYKTSSLLAEKTVHLEREREKVLLTIHFLMHIAHIKRFHQVFISIVLGRYSITREGIFLSIFERKLTSCYVIKSTVLP